MIKERKIAEKEECEKCGGDHDTKDHDKKDKAIMRGTYRELLKNKLRAMGMKNPLVMMGDDTPENVMRL